MANYIRWRVPGGTFFFTVRLQDRTSRLLVDQVDLLRCAVRSCRAVQPFHIDTAVILPDHLHMIWTLPPDDDDFPGRWRRIKSAVSRHAEAAPDRSESKRRRGEKGIWQRRYWEHAIRDAADLEAHRTYALAAPVRAGLAARPGDWRWSSVHRDGVTAGAVVAGYGPLGSVRRDGAPEPGARPGRGPLDPRG